MARLPGAINLSLDLYPSGRIPEPTADESRGIHPVVADALAAAKESVSEIQSLRARRYEMRAALEKTINASPDVRANQAAMERYLKSVQSMPVQSPEAKAIWDVELPQRLNEDRENFNRRQLLKRHDQLKIAANKADEMAYLHGNLAEFVQGQNERLATGIISPEERAMAIDGFPARQAVSKAYEKIYSNDAATVQSGMNDLDEYDAANPDKIGPGEMAKLRGLGEQRLEHWRVIGDRQLKFIGDQAEDEIDGAEVKLQGEDLSPADFAKGSEPIRQQILNDPRLTDGQRATKLRQHNEWESRFLSRQVRAFDPETMNALREEITAFDATGLGGKELKRKILAAAKEGSYGIGPVANSRVSADLKRVEKETFTLARQAIDLVRDQFKSSVAEEAKTNEILKKAGSNLSDSEKLQKMQEYVATKIFLFDTSFDQWLATHPEADPVDAFTFSQVLSTLYAQMPANRLQRLVEAQRSKPVASGVESSETRKTLDAETAKRLMEESGGDKDKARQLARERGYSF